MQETLFKANAIALLFGKRGGLFISSIWLGLVALPILDTVVLANPAENNNTPTPKILNVDPSELTPYYPASAPPGRVDPLPDERNFIDRVQETDYRVSALQADYVGNLWVASWRGLSRIDPNTGKILARVSLPNVAISALAQDKVGRLWVGTYEGLKRVDPRSNEITAQNLFLPSKRVLSLLVDKRGYLWTGTDNGLSLISPDQGLIMTTLKNYLVLVLAP